MKKKLSPKQWAGAILLLCLFILLTLFLYSRFHEDARFGKFVEKFFLTELCSNPVNLHYTLSDPAAYEIDESALALPVYRAGQIYDELEEIQSALRALKKFRPEHMSPVNQYTYILLSTYLTAAESCSSHLYYEEPLSPASGVQSGLPVLLAEYRLSSAKDIENYLSILSQIPAYLEGIALYEREKAQYGLFMSDVSADKVIEQCGTLMDRRTLEAGTHFLETTFAQRLEKLSEQNAIEASDAERWQSENERLLITVVAPAYDKLADELTLLKGSGTNTQGLACYEDGREYYQAYLRLATGSYRTVPEIMEMLSKDFKKNYVALAALLREYPALSDSLPSVNAAFPALSPEKILAGLQQLIAEDYPAIPYRTDCTVKYVDKALEPYSAPAFYMIPPIDATTENTIYINQMDTAEGLSLFTTLAHEGYPGHLYQTVYSGCYLQSIGASPLRSLLSYGGYIEGWATYAEFQSYDYAIALTKDAHPETEALYLAEKLNRQIQLCLYSMLDILIHYEGASCEKVREILSAIGVSEDEAIRGVYEYIIEEPCNYLKYYLGYLEIETLKEQAKTVWTATYGEDAFTLYRFHTFLLNNGPADFRTLSRLLMVIRPDRQSYLSEKKN
ncbi:MAG: DUF885 domain-containing protein [Blautia sp.]|nr:DUF885 domain-containing protein [Blautia sp.]MCM1201085.1 DUF885 domain-containing protein [Bacteroides fragilis]